MNWNKAKLSFAAACAVALAATPAMAYGVNAYRNQNGWNNQNNGESSYQSNQ